MSKRILLIDDDPDDQFVFCDVIGEISKDIECIVANNGIEGLVLLNKTIPTPAVIFLDLNMPLMNGFVCLQNIKAKQEYSHIPVVIFTTSDSDSDNKRAHSLGADFFFTKTANFSQLRDRLSQILRNVWKQARMF